MVTDTGHLLCHRNDNIPLFVPSETLRSTEIRRICGMHGAPERDDTRTKEFHLYEPCLSTLFGPITTSLDRYRPRMILLPYRLFGTDNVYIIQYFIVPVSVEEIRAVSNILADVVLGCELFTGPG